MANLPLGFTLLLGGGVLTVAGISGRSLGDVISGKLTAGDLSSGLSSSSISAAGSTTGEAAAGAQTAAANASGNPFTFGRSLFGGGTSAVNSAVAKVAGAMGWNQQEVQAWQGVIAKESGGSPTVLNPSSGAAGIGQFLAPGGSYSNPGPNWQKYYQYGGNPSSILGQITGMANYIKQTYGTPIAALEHENANGWY